MKRGTVTLSLHIPEARFRPGDTPDFSYLKLPKAGEAARPAVDASAARPATSPTGSSASSTMTARRSGHGTRRSPPTRS